MNRAGSQTLPHFFFWKDSEGRSAAIDVDVRHKEAF